MRAVVGLNSKQAEAVQAIDRHLLVVAGAGSGKTRVLTHKIAFLVEECGVAPSAILAMTFSNKAAAEMRERVRHLLPAYEQPQWIGTFHSVCVRILKEFAAEIGLSPNFTIYDETDQLSVIKRILEELNYDPKQMPPKVIRYQIDRAKNQTVDVLRHLREEVGLPEKQIEVADRYEKVLVANNALDFGALLTQTVRLLRERKDIAGYLRDRWKRILIDEYQDTNGIQKALILELAGTNGIVCAVGDEDQSIYGWRGARVENILEFETDFPGSALVKLEQNYRSTKQILAAANSVISHNVGRRGKELWTENDDGATVAFYHAPDDHAEAAFVLDRIEEALREGVTTPNSVSIFYRTHAQSRLLEDECRRRNRPYRVFGGLRFYDRAEVKDLLAFLKLALNPKDNVAFLRIVNRPAKGIGQKALEALAQEAIQRSSSMLEAIPSLRGTTKAEKALHLFHEWFFPLTFDAATTAPARVAEMVLAQSGYLQGLEAEHTIEADSKMENLEELLRSMGEFTEETGEMLSAYLDRISLVSDTDKYDAAEETITLMTVHNSKGLEFDCVLVVGMEEGIFPHQLSLDEGDRDKVEEERRLCYVAMTRARKRLLLTAAQRRRLYASTRFNPVSRFVGEIPARHLVEVHDSNSDFRQDRPARATVRSRFAQHQVNDEYRQESYDEVAPYPPGTRVVHPQFGMGTVRRCEGHSDNLKLTVTFQQAGTKKLMLNYCTLERVDR